MVVIAQAQVWKSDWVGFSSSPTMYGDRWGVSDTEGPRTHPKQAPVRVPPFFATRWQQHGPSPRFPFRLRLSLLSVLPPLPALAEPGLLEVLVTPCWGHRRHPALNQEGPPELERSGSEALDRWGMRGPSGASLGSLVGGVSPIVPWPWASH